MAMASVPVTAVAMATVSVTVRVGALIGVEQAIVHGLMPFLWGTLLKGAIAMALGLAGAAVIRKRLQSQP